MRRTYLLFGLFGALAFGACSSEDAAMSAGSAERSEDSWGWNGEEGDGGGAPAADPSMPDDEGTSSTSDCFSMECPVGFYCESGACVPEVPEAGLTSYRYLYFLEKSKRRIMRIDASEFQVDARETGLAPMDMKILPGGERLVLVDASHTVEVIDLEGSVEERIIWDTVRSLSHLKVSPTGEHVALFYDWDDPRALDRQSEPGNINQISILAVGESTTMEDDDEHLVDISVGLLPRDVHFSSDGTKVVVIGRRSVTSVDLRSVEEGVAAPSDTVDIDEAAVEFLVNAAASEVLLRFNADDRLEFVNLQTGDETELCFGGNITDITSIGGDEFLVAFSGPDENYLSRVDFSEAAAGCPVVPGQYSIGEAQTIVYDEASDRALAYTADASVETLWFVDFAQETQQELRLEKAVAALAFADNGGTVRITHLKTAGTPAWNPGFPDYEPTDLSIDKSNGVSWIDLATGLQRLTLRNDAFGPYGFAPGTAERAGSTFQALTEDSGPRLLVVEHSARFNESWIDLASETVHMGYIPATDSIYAIQDHPMGRVTFVDARTHSLRHVTGYALDLN